MSSDLRESPWSPHALAGNCGTNQRGSPNYRVAVSHHVTLSHRVTMSHHVTQGLTNQLSGVTVFQSPSIENLRFLSVVLKVVQYLYLHICQTNPKNHRSFSLLPLISPLHNFRPPCSAWRGCSQLWHTLAYFRNICEQDICRDIFRIFAGIFPQNLQAAGKSVSEEGRYD